MGVLSIRVPILKKSGNLFNDRVYLSLFRIPFFLLSGISRFISHKIHLFSSSKDVP